MNTNSLPIARAHSCLPAEKMLNTVEQWQMSSFILKELVTRVYLLSLALPVFLATAFCHYAIAAKRGIEFNGRSFKQHLKQGNYCVLGAIHVPTICAVAPKSCNWIYLKISSKMQQQEGSQQANIKNKHNVTPQGLIEQAIQQPSVQTIENTVICTKQKQATINPRLTKKNAALVDDTDRTVLKISNTILNDQIRSLKPIAGVVTPDVKLDVIDQKSSDVQAKKIDANIERNIQASKNSRNQNDQQKLQKVLNRLSKDASLNKDKKSLAAVLKNENVSLPDLILLEYQQKLKAINQGKDATQDASDKFEIARKRSMYKAVQRQRLKVDFSQLIVETKSRLGLEGSEKRAAILEKLEMSREQTIMNARKRAIADVIPIDDKMLARQRALEDKLVEASQQKAKNEDETTDDDWDDVDNSQQESAVKKIEADKVSSWMKPTYQFKN